MVHTNRIPQPGDLIFARILDRDAEVPSGWTLYERTDSIIIYRRADGTESVADLERMGATIYRPKPPPFH